MNREIIISVIFCITVVAGRLKILLSSSNDLFKSVLARQKILFDIDVVFCVVVDEESII